MATTTSIEPPGTTSDNPSFVLLAPNQVTFQDRPIPTLTDDYSVLVRVKHTGICGSDVHYWTHGRIGHYILNSPMVLGHESSGLVESIGNKVTSVKKGDAVAIEPGIPCRRCYHCKRGFYNMCQDVRFAATPPNDGTLGRYFMAPQDFVHKLPEGFDLVEGALVEPLSVGVHAVKQAGVENIQGARVVVFGAGPVGLLCLAVAKAFGAAEQVSVDVNEKRLEFAKEYVGAKTFLPRMDEAADALAARLNGETGWNKAVPGKEGADVALDASGAEPCIRTALHALRHGGVFVQVGMGKPDVNWPVWQMVGKELIVKSSFRYTAGDFEVAIGLLANRKVSVKEMVSERVKFEDAERAFGETKKGVGVKWIIDAPT